MNSRIWCAQLKAAAAKEDERISDVEVNAVAVARLFEFPEDIFTKAEAAKALTVLDRGLERATQLRDGGLLGYRRRDVSVWVTIRRWMSSGAAVLVVDTQILRRHAAGAAVRLAARPKRATYRIKFHRRRSGRRAKRHDGGRGPGPNTARSFWTGQQRLPLGRRG